jgi:hypothetical protein
MEYYSHENIDFKILSGVQSMCISVFCFLQHTTAILLKKIAAYSCGDISVVCRYCF